MKKFLLIAPLALITIALNAMEGQGTPRNGNGLQDFLVKKEKRKASAAFSGPKQRPEKKTKHKSNNSSSKTADSPQPELSNLLTKIKENNISEIEFLLQSSSLPVNAQSPDGETALMTAIKYSSNIKIAKLLVTHGAHINAKDDKGNTALNYALAKGDQILVNYLKFVGAEDNSENPQEACPVTKQANCDSREMRAMRPFMVPLPHNKRRTSSSALEALKRKEERATYLKQKEQKAESRLRKKLLLTGEDPIAKALFNPGDDIKSVLIDLIHCEKKSIQIAVYLLASKSIITALNEAKERGINVEIVVDTECKSKLSIAYTDFLVYNAQNNSTLMHHKFAIFEDNINHKSLLSNGSYNFTENSNEENITIFDNSILIEEFKKRFDLLKNQSK